MTVTVVLAVTVTVAVAVTVTLTVTVTVAVAVTVTVTGTVTGTVAVTVTVAVTAKSQCVRSWDTVQYSVVQCSITPLTSSLANPYSLFPFPLLTPLHPCPLLLPYPRTSALQAQLLATHAAHAKASDKERRRKGDKHSDTGEGGNLTDGETPDGDDADTDDCDVLDQSLFAGF